MRSASGSGFVGKVSVEDRARILKDDEIIAAHWGIAAWYRSKLREQSEKIRKGRDELYRQWVWRQLQKDPNLTVRVAFQTRSGKTIVRDAEVGSDRLRRLLRRRGAKELP